MTLEKLSDSDYRVADEDQDIRGWSVVDKAGASCGTIDGLLFDPDQNVVVYAIVDMRERCVLLPVGAIDLDEGEHRVRLTRFDRGQLMAMRPYQASAFHDRDEQEVYRGFVPGHPIDRRADYRDDAIQGKAPRRIRLLEEQLKIGKRRAQIGEVVAKKSVETEHVNEDVTLMQERVEIERHAVNRPVTGTEGISTEGDTIRIPIYGEELVTEKRPVVKEEIEIKKTPISKKETVRAELKHEELAFSGTEPTEADLREKERLERERRERGTP